MISVAQVAVISLIAIVYYIYRFYRYVGKYPIGPRPLPIIGNLLEISDINTHKCLEKVAKIYGPVFTVFLPKPTVVLADLASIKEALIKKGEIFAGRPRVPPEISFFQYFDNGGILLAEGDSWRQHRRFAMQTLHNFAIGKNIMEQNISNAITTLIEELDKIVDKNRADLRWPIQLCVGSVINEIMFGYKLTSKNCEKFVYLVKTLDTMINMARSRKIVYCMQQYPWIKYIPFVSYYAYYEIHEMSKKIFDYLSAEIASQEKQFDINTMEATNFVQSYLIEKKKREEQYGDYTSFSRNQIINVVYDFWLAGLETTTTTLRWAVVYLIANPDVQLKIQTEIDSIVGHDRSVTMADKPAMPYTSAAILELQRLANILPFNLLHKTLADTEIFDKPIPANTLVLPQISAVMSDPTVFTDPMRYDPDRFLDLDKKHLRRDINENFVAFGLGNRQCAGEELARMELFLTLANLLQTYELRTGVDEAMPDLTPIYSGICYPKHYECQIVKRINR